MTAKPVTVNHIIYIYSLYFNTKIISKKLNGENNSCLFYIQSFGSYQLSTDLQRSAVVKG